MKFYYDFALISNGIFPLTLPSKPPRSISRHAFSSSKIGSTSSLRACPMASCELQTGSLRSTAKQMGISAPYLSDIVNGRRHISDAVVKKLAKLK